MALDDAAVKELLKQLEADREAYLATVARTHELLVKTLSSKSNPTSPSSSRILEQVPETSQLKSSHDPAKRLGAGTSESLAQSSSFSIDDDDATDDDESLFVQETLPPESYTEEQLRYHLKSHPWNEYGYDILDPILRDRQYLDRTSLFPLDARPVPDRSHLSHHNVYEVGTDGAPLPHRPSSTTGQVSKSLAIWQSLNMTNSDPARQRHAVGKIIIVREPSPILFGAIHLTMNQHFDMDGIFTLLADSNPSRAYMTRSFAADPRQQRSFVFSFKYFTIIGDDRKPMDWQQSDADRRRSAVHIPISRCSSVVALSLSGDPTATVKNKARRAKTEVGKVYDPFSPWRVLSIQCFPDWKSTMDSHDSTKHYVNGPEAFLLTLLTEYRDAQKRFMEIHRRIMDFMFNKKTRDDLLFEDDRYTYSRRYFWCFQTLAIMSDNIQAMVDAYRETFTDDVWNGRHKTIWPGTPDTSARYGHWRRRMGGLRKELDREIEQLERIMWLNYREQKDIQALRDHLFSGTSVLESRKSVEQALITVQQGHNIKLLTLVTIFFLPLTFVTSIFGMTNMPTEIDFKPFGIVVVIICVPTYMLIGTLNSTRGLEFCKAKVQALGRNIAGLFKFLFGLKQVDENGSQTDDDDSGKPECHQIGRSKSTRENMAIRYGEPDSTTITNSRSGGISRSSTWAEPQTEMRPLARPYDHHHQRDYHQQQQQQQQRDDDREQAESTTTFPKTIKFNPLAYEEKQREARRVSVSNIGPLSDENGQEGEDGNGPELSGRKRGILHSLGTKGAATRQYRDQEGEIC